MKKKIDLRLAMNHQQTAAWNMVRPIIRRALVGDGALEAYRRLKRSDPSRAAAVRARSKRFSELLDMIGE